MSVFIGNYNILTQNTNLLIVGLTQTTIKKPKLTNKCSEKLADYWFSKEPIGSEFEAKTASKDQ